MESQVAVLSADGSLDMATAGGLEAAASRAMTGHATVVLDLRRVWMCDSSGLGALVRIWRHAETTGRGFELRAPQPQVDSLLAMTGIDTVVPVQRPSRPVRPPPTQRPRRRLRRRLG
jgi:anti-sigma B factor antagonist